MENFIDYDEFIRILGKKNAFPILILDEIWLNRFPQKHKNKKTKELQLQLKEELKREGKFNNELKALNSLKNKYLQSIIDLTGKLDVEETVGFITNDMQEYKVRVEEINRQIQELEVILVEIPEKIKKINFDLMEETVITCYNIMRKSEERLNKVIPRIDELRIELEDLVNERLRLEIDKHNTFSLLHSMVGKEVMNYLDKNIERNR